VQKRKFVSLNFESVYLTSGKVTVESKTWFILYADSVSGFLIPVTILFLLFACFSFFGYTQIKSTGTPNILNYQKSEYNAGTQNWGIAQDKNGFMYFANNDGVLRFDGLHWELFAVPRVPVRSILIDSENRIFVGMFNDFGMLNRDSSGKIYFESLRQLLPDSAIEFDDIWKIHETSQGIVFQSFDFMFILNNNKLEVIRPQKQFHFSFYLDEKLFVQEPGIGLFQNVNGLNEPVPWAESLKEMEIRSILINNDNEFLIGTSRSGIFEYKNGVLEKWDTPVNKLIEEFTLFCTIKIADGYFAFGTITNGILIADSEGNIIQQISKKQGLQNNTILSMYADDSDNLWLGLDNGIDYVETNSPVTYISENDGFGTGYTARIFNNKLYLGTNQGLFVRPFEEGLHHEENFKLVRNSTGQVWSLGIFEGQLICGHNVGTFRIEDENAVPISGEEGGWTYIRLQDNPEFLLGGHFTGLQLFKLVNGEWKFQTTVKGFDVSSRYLVQDDNGTIWMSHGGIGVFKISLTANLDSVSDYKLYTDENGLPSDEQNIIFEFNGQALVSATDGIYRYDNEEDTFVISNELNKLFNFHGRLKTLKTDDAGNVWFIADQESGVFRINEDLTYTKITSPFKQLDNKYVNEFEFLYPYDNNNVFMAIDEGFAHYSSNFPKSYSEPFKSFITRVEITYLDSIIHFSDINDVTNYSFPFRKNSFRFQYTASFYEHPDQLLFSFILEDFTDEWSQWSTYNYRDFTNLPEGEYTFRVKARNIYGVESEISTFKFTITPPWHRSVIAFYVYIFLAGMFVFLVVKFVLYRIKVAKRKEAKKHRQELEKKEENFQRQTLIAEKEIIKLRNDKLRAEKTHRDKELANQTMSIIQKNKFLTRLSEELQRVQNSTDDSGVKTKMALIKNRIKREIDNQQQQKLFETYFEDVHNEFFERLREKHSQLTPNDLKLCAYIRMNISTKEMATLLNISYRGVEISRYRLRKKLDLSRDVNLATYLSNI
jgi:DNA-binding CsgD family transcriptional regulator/F0F1-type ATP synthase membrane subunit b/b'